MEVILIPDSAPLIALYIKTFTRWFLVQRHDRADCTEGPDLISLVRYVFIYVFGITRILCSVSVSSMILALGSVILLDGFASLIHQNFPAPLAHVPVDFLWLAWAVPRSFNLQKKKEREVEGEIKRETATRPEREGVSERKRVIGTE